MAPDRESPQERSGNARAQFTTTHWSVVLAARRGTSSEAPAALEQLCQTYWYPLYAYVRRWGYGEPDAEDLTQGFLAHLLAQPFLEGVAREKGKFRSFLLASLQNFLADQKDRATALKRGAGQRCISLDGDEAAARYAREPIDTLSPDKLFERRWAMVLLERAQDRLQAEYRAADKAQLYETLRQFNTGGSSELTYSEGAAQLGIPENTLKSLVHRLRRRYRQLLREEIAQTVSTRAEVDEEIRHLLQVTSG